MTTQVALLFRVWPSKSRVRAGAMWITAILGLAYSLTSSNAHARGGHGGGHGSAHGSAHSSGGHAGGSFGGTAHAGTSHAVGVHFGGSGPASVPNVGSGHVTISGHIGLGAMPNHGIAGHAPSVYIGSHPVWTFPHWGRGYWGRRGSAWTWIDFRWWTTPAYPGWIWVAPQWVWDGQQWVRQEGYWAWIG